MNRKLYAVLGGLAALVVLSAGTCDDAKAPEVDIPTSPAPNGDPTPGGKCSGGPEHTIVIDGKTYECWDRHWRLKQ
jgi:hypothetical protein